LVQWPANLKLLRSLKWHWLTQLKSNREVSLDRSGNRAISEIFIPPQGCLVHLKGYGWIKVFRTVDKKGDANTGDQPPEYDPCGSRFSCLDACRLRFIIVVSNSYRIERGQYRLEVSQRNHIGLAIRAFVRLEVLSHSDRYISWLLKLRQALFGPPCD